MHTLTQKEAEDIKKALLADDDPPTHYGLSINDLDGIASYFDWPNRLEDFNWNSTSKFNTLAEMAADDNHRGDFLADISEFYGDDYYEDRRAR